MRATSCYSMKPNYLVNSRNYRDHRFLFNTLHKVSFYSFILIFSSHCIWLWMLSSSLKRNGPNFFLQGHTPSLIFFKNSIEMLFLLIHRNVDLFELLYSIFNAKNFNSYHPMCVCVCVCACVFTEPLYTSRTWHKVSF